MKYSSIIFAVIAIALCVSLVFAENLTPAYALSVTNYANNGENPHSIIRCGSSIVTTDFTNSDINFFSASSPSTFLGELTTGGGFYIGCSADGTRAYTYTSGGTLQEVDVVNRALLRSLATGCDSSAIFPNIGASSTFVCGTSGGTDLVKIINLGTMAITYTSTTLDAGANTCDNISGLWYETAIDTLFASCSNVSDEVVAVVGFTVSGTPDFSIATSANPTSVAFNNVDSKVIVGDSGAFTSFYDYSASTGFTAGTIITNGQCGTAQCMDFDAATGWFITIDGDGFLRLLDAQAETVILDISLGSVGASNGFHFYTQTNIPVALGASNNFAIVDATGVELGEGATGGGGGAGTGDLDCTLPENENILICRLGGDGSLVGAGNFIVGNVNGTTGLTPIICATGIVDCVANPDMKTNGVGYLLVTIALAIIIGILWVASRGDLNSIPTFIWFIATLAVVGAFTLMDLIDATFLVITVVFIIALAAAKARGLFGGGDFK